MVACPRCGPNTADYVPGLPHSGCWDHRADAELVHALADAMRTGNYRAYVGPLGEIGDPVAAPALRDYLADSDPRIRCCVVKSLGWSGDESDLGRLAPLLADPDAYVRKMTALSIAEIGGVRAADVLAAHVAAPSVEDEVVEQIGHLLFLLNDSRCQQPLWQSFNADRRRLEDLGDLVLFGNAAALRTLEELLAAALADAQTTPEDTSRAVGLLHGLADQLRRLPIATRARLTETITLVDRQLAERLRLLARSPQPTERSAAPTVERTVPRTTLVFSDRRATATEPPISESGAAQPPLKFLGQPDWRETPAWPHTPDGDPLRFYGQMPLPTGATAYVFLGGDEEWQPLGPGNAVVVQPGPQTHLPTRPMATGPCSHLSVADTSSPVRRRFRQVPAPPIYPTTQPGLDPVAWRPEDWLEEQLGDWDKLGGTPRFLQSEEHPPGEGWQFAFQFTAGYAEERGDGAMCYGFVNEDGRGAFLWQCH